MPPLNQDAQGEVALFRFEVLLPDTEMGMGSNGFIYKAERIGKVSFAHVNMLLIGLGQLDGPNYLYAEPDPPQQDGPPAHGMPPHGALRSTEEPAEAQASEN